MKTPRVALKSKDETEPEDVVQLIRTRRGGRLNEADRVLIYSPPVARAWTEMLGALGKSLILPRKIQEIAIFGIGIMTGCQFQILGHGRHFINAGGTQRQLDAMRDYEKACRNSELFSETERLIMQYTIESTRAVAIGDATYSAIQREFPDARQQVELAALVAGHNMVARFLVALQVEKEA